MAIGKVSNQGSRMVAIFKVLGVYLLTLLLLIWIFSFNVQSVNEQPSDPIKADFEAVKQDTANLKLMVGYIDTIAAITSQLIRLDHQELAEPGSAAADIEELIAMRKRFYEELVNLKEGENLTAEKNKLKKVYAVLVQNRIRIRELDIKIKATQEDADKSLNDALEQAESDSEGESEQLTSELENTESSLQEVKDELKETKADLKTAKTNYDKLKEKNGAILEKVKEIRGLIEQEKTSSSWLSSNWKKVVEVVYPKITALESFVEE